MLFYCWPLLVQNISMCNESVWPKTGTTYVFLPTFLQWYNRWGITGRAEGILASEEQMLFQGINTKLPRVIQFPWPTSDMSTFLLPHTSKQKTCNIPHIIQRHAAVITHMLVFVKAIKKFFVLCGVSGFNINLTRLSVVPILSPINSFLKFPALSSIPF
jgi:hypothetical protein